jgi:hypothetical protein
MRCRSGGLAAEGRLLTDIGPLEKALDPSPRCRGLGFFRKYSPSKLPWTTNSLTTIPTNNDIVDSPPFNNLDDQ